MVVESSVQARSIGNAYMILEVYNKHKKQFQNPLCSFKNTEEVKRVLSKWQKGYKKV